MTISGERYGLEGTFVIEVVPAIELSPPHTEASPVVCGEFAYHGERVPVIDGGLLVSGRVSTKSLSTRIVILSLEFSQNRQLFGLMAEEMTETTQLKSNIVDERQYCDTKLETATEQALVRGFRIINPFYLHKLVHGS